MVYIWKIRWQEVIKMDLCNKRVWRLVFWNIHCKNLKLWTCCAYYHNLKSMWGDGADGIICYFCEIATWWDVYVQLTIWPRAVSLASRRHSGIYQFHNKDSLRYHSLLEIFWLPNEKKNLFYSPVSNIPGNDTFRYWWKLMWSDFQTCFPIFRTFHLNINSDHVILSVTNQIIRLNLDRLFALRKPI